MRNNSLQDLLSIRGPFRNAPQLFILRFAPRFFEQLQGGLLQAVIITRDGNGADPWHRFLLGLQHGAGARFIEERGRGRNFVEAVHARDNRASIDEWIPLP